MAHVIMLGHQNIIPATTCGAILKGFVSCENKPLNFVQLE
jgi:hypothetical protein